MTEIRPFRVEISDAVIDDLHERLARTRWPETEPVDDWSMGIPLAYVQERAGFWAASYEMQREADQLNRYEQFTTSIDGSTSTSSACARPLRGRRRAPSSRTAGRDRSWSSSR
jgi:hypothetical protein